MFLVERIMKCRACENQDIISSPNLAQNMDLHGNTFYEDTCIIVKYLAMPIISLKSNRIVNKTILQYLRLIFWSLKVTMFNVFNIHNIADPFVVALPYKGLETETSMLSIRGWKLACHI